MQKIMLKICSVALIIMLFSGVCLAKSGDKHVLNSVRYSLWYQGIDMSEGIQYDSPEQVELAEQSEPEYPAELLIPLVREIEIF